MYVILCPVGYKPRIGISCWFRVESLAMGGTDTTTPAALI